MSGIVYLNGEFINKEDAKISPDDRGFIFADGVYEVIKYYHGKPFRFQNHIERLKHSLAELNISYPVINDLETVSMDLIDRNSLQEKHAGVYIQITRGVHKRIHSFPEGIKPTIYAFAYNLPSNRENLDNGIKVITAEDIRWTRCDIKSVSLLPNVMLFNKAIESGAGECILIRNGFVTEAAHSSVLGIKNGTVITHPSSNLILPGITRKVILEICAQNDIPIEERPLTENELYEMDEVIIAGTGNEITAAIQVNDKLIGNNKPGEITRLIQRKFFELV
ncbi:MAG: D-amino-acid transaminase [Bacteroidota bacterium]